ncbi:MAG: adenine deaminase [Desulfurococcaceae archaeon]
MSSVSLFGYDPEERASLIRAARGLIPADVAIVNANVVSVATGEVLEGLAVIVKGRRVAALVPAGDASRYVGSDTLVVDAGGDYALPGFIDPHIHIESSLLDPYGFSKVALAHGTTAVVADPHEIANVLGSEGVRLFADASASLPLKILIDVPSCVPATDPSLGLETSGSVIGAKEVAELLSMKSSVGLGEVMDFVSVLEGRAEVLSKVRAAHEGCRAVDGHAPLLRTPDLDAYISAGIGSDHESTSLEEALEKVRRGMFVYLREGSAWKDLRNLVGLARDLDCALCSFTSDDVNVLDLFEQGHMDRIVNLAIEYGVDPIRAIKYATLHPALRYGLVDHVGLVAPGRFADVVLTHSIERIRPHTVFASGRTIYYKGELMEKLERPSYPDWALNSVRVKRVPGPEDLVPSAGLSEGVAKVNVIEAFPGSTLTKRSVEDVPIAGGKLRSMPERDLAYVAVVERHRATGNMAVGLVRGLGIGFGGIAQTIAHDSHNIIVAGLDPRDMSMAVEEVVRIQGGIAVYDGGKLVGEVELRLAGLMSVKEPEEVYKEVSGLINRLHAEYGMDFHAFFMTLALLALPVIPEIRLTDRGLVDVMGARLIPLIVEERP